MKPNRIIAFVICFGALALVVAPAFTSAQGWDTQISEYTVGIDGSKGVKLRMLLITKSDKRIAPTRESKIVTVPFQTTFKARLFYVWFDTLENGASGNDGDRIMSVYKINGELQGAGFGGTIKKANNSSWSFGNL